MTKQRFGAAKYIEINKQLEWYCNKVEGGYAEYQKDWNDSRVASICEVSNSSVATVRKQLYGKLRESPKVVAAQAAVFEARVADLERQVKGLDEALAKVEARLEQMWNWCKGRGFHMSSEEVAMAMKLRQSAQELKNKYNNGTRS